MAPERSKKRAQDVSLSQVPEMPNLYYICNLAFAWQKWWRFLLAFRGPDYGIIIAGKDERAGAAMIREWRYIASGLCWLEFSEYEAENPKVYTNLNVLSRDLFYLSELPMHLRFRPMLWIRSEEGWRVPLDRLLARGIRIYTAAEVEEHRQRREERHQWLEENFRPPGDE